MGTYNSYKVLLMMTGEMVLAGFLVVLCGYSLGAIFARVVCLTGDKVIAISIETALQNPGVAFILLKLSLDSPYRWEQRGLSLCVGTLLLLFCFVLFFFFSLLSYSEK